MKKNKKLIVSALLGLCVLGGGLEPVGANSTQCEVLNKHIRALGDHTIPHFPLSVGPLSSPSGKATFEYVLSDVSKTTLNELQQKEVVHEGKSRIFSDGATTYDISGLPYGPLYTGVKNRELFWACILSIPTSDSKTNYVFTPIFYVKNVSH